MRNEKPHCETKSNLQKAIDNENLSPACQYGANFEGQLGYPKAWDLCQPPRCEYDLSRSGSNVRHEEAQEPKDAE